MDERDIKRMPIVVPRELYERFQACSRDENKTNTAMVLEWMKNYVKENEPPRDCRRSNPVGE